MPDADQPRIRATLAATPAGRIVAETLDMRIAPDWSLGPERRSGGSPVWRQRDGSCVNLDLASRACELHHAAGLAALPASCRNFPRWVTALPDRIEAAFALTCPTAARLLATDPAPWAMVAQPASAWPYAPTSTVAGEVALTADRTAPLHDVLGLREAWWAELDRARASPAALAQSIARLAVSPLTPPRGSGPEAPETPETVLASGVAQVALGALERLPDRPAYAPVRWEVFAELVQPMTPRVFGYAIEPLVELVARFACHGIQWLGVHDPRPVEVVARIVARRAVLVVRLVDALCARVPYPLATLARDAFSAASYVDA